LQLLTLNRQKRFDEQVAATYEQRAEKQRSAGETTKADEDQARAKEIREAMIEKPAAARDTSTAEGFNPDSSVQ